MSSKAAVNPGAFDLFDVYSITKSAAHFMFGSLATRGARVLQVGAPPPPFSAALCHPPCCRLTRRCCCRCAVLPLTRYPLLLFTLPFCFCRCAVLPRPDEDRYDGGAALAGVAVGGARGLGQRNGVTDSGMRERREVGAGY